MQGPTPAYHKQNKKVKSKQKQFYSSSAVIIWWSCITNPYSQGEKIAIRGRLPCCASSMLSSIPCNFPQADQASGVIQSVTDIQKVGTGLAEVDLVC